MEAWAWFCEVFWNDEFYLNHFCGYEPGNIAVLVFLSDLGGKDVFYLELFIVSSFFKNKLELNLCMKIYTT